MFQCILQKLFKKIRYPSQCEQTLDSLCIHISTGKNFEFSNTEFICFDAGICPARGKAHAGWYCKESQATLR